jgi:hypothetical protein
MGLLDDAIREHLELKRRRGADPGEVAREQHEALDDPLGTEVGQIEDLSSSGSAPPSPLTYDAAASNLLEETAELDMQSVLDQRADSANIEDMSDSSTGSGLPADGVPETAAKEEHLEWEVPGEGMRGRASEAAGREPGQQEAIGGEGVEHAHPPAEDVVAEMTDDPNETSEQDRLWLERNTPPDVDRDK